uniref:Uncharacterized protein n=1 Tax=Vitis vinifera TaxID=29760 RepID=F6HTY4_VITVI
MKSGWRLGREENELFEKKVGNKFRGGTEKRLKSFSRGDIRGEKKKEKKTRDKKKKRHC